jgi:hypothetical protein
MLYSASGPLGEPSSNPWDIFVPMVAENHPTLAAPDTPSDSPDFEPDTTIRRLHLASDMKVDLAFLILE